MRVTRRKLVGGLVIAPAAMALSPWARSTSSSITSELFQHGVASGDPDEQSVVIWTRVTTDRPSVKVVWEVSFDPAFSRSVQRGECEASYHRDHTVKVIVAGLPPAQRCYFRFKAAGETSAIGRTKTLPAGDTKALGLALVSCSNYAFGHFNAYDAIARDDEIDYVLHTGDYIYEYGVAGWGGDVSRRLKREHQPRHEILSLADYRQRHAQYKQDAGSLAMHAAHPLICLWDDHESANNPWIGGAQNHQDDEGLWRDRRQASVRAYYEWMPIRDPAPTLHRDEYYRGYSFGSLATLITLETRHTARARQINYEDHFGSIKSHQDARRFEADVLGRPGRRMLSTGMDDFLRAALQKSVQVKQPWRLIGNAIPMARTPVPDVEALGVRMPATESSAPGTGADLLWKGRFNLPFYLDTWDGYPWARERFYQLCRECQSRDLLVLTGDSHSFWANRLTDDGNQSMGVEIGTAGVTSPGDFLDSGFDADTARLLDQAFSEQIADVRWTSNMHQGYVKLRLMEEAAQVDFMAVSTVQSPEYTLASVHQEVIVREAASLGFI